MLTDGLKKNNTADCEVMSSASSSSSFTASSQLLPSEAWAPALLPQIEEMTIACQPYSKELASARIFGDFLLARQQDLSRIQLVATEAPTLFSGATLMSSRWTVRKGFAIIGACSPIQPKPLQRASWPLPLCASIPRLRFHRLGPPSRPAF